MIVDERKALMDESEALVAKDKSQMRKKYFWLVVIGIIGLVIWNLLASSAAVRNTGIGTCCCCLAGLFGFAYFGETLGDLNWLDDGITGRTKVNKRVREIEIERQEYEKQLEDEKK